MNKELEEALRKSAKLVKEMSQEEYDEMFRLQKESFIRSIERCEHGNDWMDCSDCWAAIN